MREFWGVLGGVLINPRFHDELFQHSAKGVAFEDLGDLCGALWGRGFGFGRWEVMTLQLALIESHIDAFALPPRSVQNSQGDTVIRRVQEKWAELNLPIMDIAHGFQLYSAIGCAAVDVLFRNRLLGASRPGPDPDLRPLRAVLEQTPPQGPQFNLSLAQLKALNSFLASQQGLAVDLLEEFHTQKWVQPDADPCPVGYSLGGPGIYSHLSWPRLLAASLRTNGPIPKPDLNTLRLSGALLRKG